MKKNEFTRGVEKQVNPITVGSLHFLQQYNKMLPVAFQNKIVAASAKKNPYMGFIVEPYCTFLFKKIVNVDYFKSILPNNFELIKSAPFAGDEEDYYLIISLFNARTSAFFGSRAEAYVIAEDTKTNLTSWIIVDYITNTISHDNKHGLSSPTCKDSFVTTDFAGNVIAQMNDENHRVNLTVNIENGTMRNLDEKLWIEGNLSVGYSTKYEKDGSTFSLKFDKREMSTALDIDLDDISEYDVDWFSEYVCDDDTKVVVFKYAQHFLSDSPGHYSNIRSISELETEVEKTDFTNIKPYSIDGLSNKMLAVPIVLTILIIILLLT